MITPKQMKAIYALMPPEIKNDREAKADLVGQYTSKKSHTSTKDLSFAQANRLMKDLGGKAMVNRWGLFDAKNPAHRYVLSLCMQIGWNVSGVADMNKFSTWLQSKRSPVCKPLPDMSSAEVSRIITALEGILKTKKV